MIRIPKGFHKGKRAFIIASGPSTKRMDFGWLKNEVTICVNQSYRLLKFDPTYICISDEALWESMVKVYPTKKSKIIACFSQPKKYMESYPGKNLAVIFKNLGHAKGDIPKFSFDLEKGIWSSRNVVPTVAIPFACWAGFSEVYLIGCDCTNNGYGYEGGVRIAEQKFHAETMLHYEKIAKAQLPTKIYNSTKGGQLEYFPRKALERVKRRNLIITGYYTDNGDYEERSFFMKRSVEKYGLTCHIEKYKNKINDGVDPKLRWSLNANIKPYHMQRMRQKFPNDDLFCLDVDAEMVRQPRLLFNLGGKLDFAAVFIYNRLLRAKQLCGGGLFFAATAKANKLLDLWAERQRWRDQELKEGIYQLPCAISQDQETLQKLVYLVPGLVWAELPLECGYIEKTPSGKDIMPMIKEPVIVHHQASRKFRKVK